MMGWPKVKGRINWELGTAEEEAAAMMELIGLVGQNPCFFQMLKERCIMDGNANWLVC
jgi:hypothetical protein